jgi:hypothetical protein
MQFSDTTNLTGLIQDCEFLTNIGTGNISGNATKLKQFTSFINERSRTVLTLILQAQDEWDYDDKNYTDFPILTTSLVKDQTDYALPLVSDDMLKIKRVEIKYRDTWAKAFPIDISEFRRETTSDSAKTIFGEGSPRYDFQYGSMFLYPTPTVASANGLKIWINRDISEFSSTDTTKKPGFDAPFHKMLSIGASLDWAIAKNLPNVGTLAQLWADYEDRIIKHYGSKQEDRINQIKVGEERMD